MARFSPKLASILITRGTLRAVLPLYVLWSIIAWWFRVPWVAIVFGVLTINYVWVYVMSWIAPSLMHGWWRVRPIQTFILLANMIAFPIVHYRMYGVIPWLFIGLSVLLIVSLYVSTVLHAYLQQRLPMGAAFAHQKLTNAGAGTNV